MYYKFEIVPSPVNALRGDGPHLFDTETPEFMQAGMWISSGALVAHVESMEEIDPLSGTSYINHREVRAIMLLLRKFKAGRKYAFHKIGILSAYHGQVRLLRQTIENADFMTKEAKSM